MYASVITLLLLGGLLLWIFAWQHGSQLARGIAIGAILVLVCEPLVRAVIAQEHLPVWVPALPFALIAITLFGYGLLAWYWGEE